jgi:hypothetical protein
MFVDVNEMNRMAMPSFPNMDKPAGREHYRLLRFLASQPEIETVYDIGTYRGYSALALALGGANVVSYDVEDLRDKTAQNEAIRFHVGDCLQDEGLMGADMIVLDTYHDGLFENKFYEFIRRDYQGVLVLDDIYLNDQMRNFWSSITERKIDMTKVGHYTGTGMVIL